MQGIRGLVVGSLVGVAVGAFVMTSLHATTVVGLLGGACVGLSVFAVVATKSDASDEAADAAWQAASRDLPPVSDRANLERMQANMPGPGQKRAQRRPGVTPSGAAPAPSSAGSAISTEAESGDAAGSPSIPGNDGAKAR